MSVSPLISGVSHMTATRAIETAAGRRASFAEQLRSAGRGKLVEEARTASEQLVSSAFILPVLAELRSSSMSEGPFAPGDTERRFGPVLDQHIADRLTQRSHFPLVDRLTEDLLRPAASRLGRR
jgi:hypothetical protein